MIAHDTFDHRIKICIKTKIDNRGLELNLVEDNVFFLSRSNNQLSDLLQTSLIRLNSIDRRDISQFEYEVLIK